MYGFGGHPGLREAREYRETMTHVVRDLSRELARYLDAAGMQIDL